MTFPTINAPRFTVQHYERGNFWYVLDTKLARDMFPRWDSPTLAASQCAYLNKSY